MMTDVKYSPLKHLESHVLLLVSPCCLSLVLHGLTTPCNAHHREFLELSFPQLDLLAVVIMLVAFCHALWEI